MIFGKPNTSPGSTPFSPAAPPRRPASSPATWSFRSTDDRSRASRICSRSSAPAPARRWCSRWSAAARSHSQGGAGAQGDPRTDFGNVHRIGVLGITRSPSPEDAQVPAGRAAQGRRARARKETWFVVERTLSYIGGVDLGTGGCRPARRPDSHRAGVGAGGQRGPSVVDSALLRCCRCRSGC